YNGVPIPKPDMRPELAMPVLYWVPVIAPGNLMFYRGTQTFPQWNGNGFVSGMGTTSLSRIIFDGHGGAKMAERWNVGKRVRDVEEGPDGSLWILEGANPGSLLPVTPKGLPLGGERKEKAGAIRPFLFEKTIRDEEAHAPTQS